MRFIALLAILLLSACGSPATHYFSLQPMPQAGGAVPADTGISRKPPIVIRHVMLPANLDRLSIVSTDSAGELTISGLDRWASPLDGMVQATLGADLAAQLPGQVIIPGDPVPPGDTRALAVTIRVFSGNSAGQVTLRADWFLLLDDRPVPGVGRSETITVDAGSARSDAVVPAMSEALFRLSKHIAQAIGAHAGRRRVGGT